MLVKDVDGELLTWFGTNELPASVEFTMTDAELAAHGLIRVQPEDTTPPTPYHVVTDATRLERFEGGVRRVCDFALTTDEAAAREAATAVMQEGRNAAQEIATRTWPYAGPDDDIIAAFDAKEQAHRDFIATASVYELSMRIWTWPSIEDLHA